jgi:hypothetical protein
MKKIESDFISLFMGQRFKTSDSNMQTQSQTQSNSLDVLQQFDLLLKNHSIVVSDRENLAKLFENIVDLCTQMPKTKLKAALKAATQEPKPKPKAQSKPKAQPKAQPKEVMVGADGAGDAPVISDLPVVPLARGRGRPRKVAPEPTVAVAVAEANANPNAETAEKKRRGRPKKDKSVTISSNDDEDALIAKMMADVASMQKEDEISAQAAAATATATAESVVIPDPATDDDETESVCSVLSEFTGPLMRCEEMTPRADSVSPVIHAASSGSFQQLDVEVSVPAKAPKSKAPKAPKAAKEPVVKAPKAPKAAKEPVVKATKAAKEPKAKANAKKGVEKVAEVVVAEEVVVAPLASFPALDAPLVLAQQHATSGPENKESNGKIYLMPRVPTTSFSYSGKTYLRTETDNVYDNLTHELIGVWDHSNHEIIAAFDDEEVEEVEELWFSDEE